MGYLPRLRFKATSSFQSGFLLAPPADGGGRRPAATYQNQLLALAAVKRMKTNIETPAAVSQPGNLNVRQLAKSLIAAPAAAKTNEPAKPGAAAETREVPPPENGEATEKLEEKTEISPEEQARLEAKASETGKSVADILAEEEAEQTAQAEEQTRLEAKAAETGKTVEEVLAEEQADETSALPEANITEAMAQRIEAELGPLIEELTKAGAKGALQILQKRIPKLVDQRDTERNARLTAEAEREQLRTELVDARGKATETVALPGNGTLHPEVAKVVGELNNVDHWLGWCEQYPEGGELPDGKGGKLELTEAQVKEMRRTLQNERTEVVARKVQTEREVRAEYQQQYQQHHTKAVAEYPWMTKETAPEHQEMQAILKVAPWFKQSPDFELALGDFIAGKAMRLAKAKAKPANGVLPRKVTPSREPTRVVAEPPGSSAARKAPGKARKDEADAQFKKTGRTSDLAKSFAAERQASRAGG